MKISELKINPENPRTISEAKIEKLISSIKDFPGMMELRPIVYDPETMIILGGNMRYLAMQKLGYKDIPEGWILPADKLTQEEKRRFIIEDNVQFGEWDDIALDKWNIDDLIGWGLKDELEVIEKPETRNLKPFKKTHILISFHPDDLIKIQKHLEEIKKIPGIEFLQSSN